jgi:hypothetical protein
MLIEGNILKIIGIFYTNSIFNNLSKFCGLLFVIIYKKGNIIYFNESHKDSPKWHEKNKPGGWWLKVALMNLPINSSFSQIVLDNIDNLFNMKYIWAIMECVLPPTLLL